MDELNSASTNLVVGNVCPWHYGIFRSRVSLKIFLAMFNYSALFLFEGDGLLTWSGFWMVMGGQWEQWRILSKLTGDLKRW